MRMLAHAQRIARAPLEVQAASTTLVVAGSGWRARQLPTPATMQLTSARRSHDERKRVTALWARCEVVHAEPIQPNDETQVYSSCVG
jgi:hypothetical protein